MTVRVVYAGPSYLVFAIVERELSNRGVTVASYARTLPDLLEQCRVHLPEVVVTDLVLGDHTIDHTTVSTIHSFGSRILLLCNDPEGTLLTAALFAGASGFLLLRDATPEHLAKAVDSVANGDAVLHPAIAASIVEQWRRDRAEMMAHPMTITRVELGARELDVLAAMADGLSTKAIARRLTVSSKTIESHKTRIFAKLGAKNQAHAVAIALELHLLSNVSNDKR